MKQHWLAKNILSNVVVILTYLILGSENIPPIPSLIAGYIASMTIGNLVFPVPEDIKNKVEAHWQQEDPSTVTVGIVILILSLINAFAIYFTWQWLTGFDIDENTALVGTILFYNAGCTLFDRHAMKMLEEELS